MNKPLELVYLLGRYFVRVILIALIILAVIILFGQEDCIGGFCDH